MKLFSPKFTIIIALVCILLGIASWQVHKRIRGQDLKEFFEDKSFQNDAISLKRGLDLIWLGTAGVYIGDGRSGVLIDPFVSKYALGHIFLDRKIEPKEDKIKELIEGLKDLPVNAVIVSHSHYDHVLDAPSIAKHYNVPVLGSSSTAAISEIHGHKNTIIAESQDSFTFGKFIVTLRKSEHGASILDKYRFPGEVEVGSKLRYPSDYKLGDVYGIHVQHPELTVTHHASSSFLPDMYQGLSSDVVFLGLALRESTETLLKRIQDELNPVMVVSIHFDNFFIEDGGVNELPLVDLEEFDQKATQSFGALKVRYIKPGKLVRIAR